MLFFSFHGKVSGVGILVLGLENKHLVDFYVMKHPTASMLIKLNGEIYSFRNWQQNYQSSLLNMVVKSFLKRI